MWKSHFHLPSPLYHIPTNSIHRSGHLCLPNRPKLPFSTYSLKYDAKANANSPSPPAQRQCHCSEIPNLDIDRGTPLKGTMPKYNTQVLVSTGKHDWNSKIESEEGLAADLKGVLGRAGRNKGFEELRDVIFVSFLHPSNYETYQEKFKVAP